MDFYASESYYLARLIFERSLGAVFFVAFLSAYNQFIPLLGERGLLPVPDYLKRMTFKESPSLFHGMYSDRIVKLTCLLGMLLGLIFAFGGFAHSPIIVHLLAWLALYFLYLSLVNVGQVFYGFGWESMLLEAGFFAAFMGPQWVAPSWIPILILRWMLFRTEMGAGLIKMRGDSCWRDLTCLYYHHETQPLPNPLSRSFHHLPKRIHRFGVVFSHFCQLVAPMGVFLPQPFAAISGLFLISHQLILVVSGNYSWLNWLTIILGILCFADPVDTRVEVSERPMWFEILQWGVLIFTLSLSRNPFRNLFSKKQYMNYCWNRWHLVGAYGAFGSVTKKRYEIVIEGTEEEYPGPETQWLEYGFRGKPVELNRRPPIVAPYHLRLDWMIWFLPFSVYVKDKEMYVPGHDLWFIRLLIKLLKNDEHLLVLFRHNPFPERPPLWVRAKFYQYQFTDRNESQKSGNIWKRQLIGDYCPQVSLNELSSLLK